MIQINTCTLEDIKRLPGVGPATAQKIIEARPIRDIKQLEEIIPPSAWLKIQGAGVEFGFDMPEVPPGVMIIPKKLSDEEVARLKELWEEAMAGKAEEFAKVPIIKEFTFPPITLLQGTERLTLRRVMPGQSLRQGASYLCIWNMKWGTAGEAITPRDTAIEVEVETKLQSYGIKIAFAHYMPSVRVGTNSYGHVPVLLFEIIEEKQDDSEAESATDAGAGQGDA